MKTMQILFLVVKIERQKIYPYSRNSCNITSQNRHFTIEQLPPNSINSTPSHKVQTNYIEKVFQNIHGMHQKHVHKRCFCS